MDNLKKCLSLILMALCCAYTIDGFSQDSMESKEDVYVNDFLAKNNLKKEDVKTIDISIESEIKDGKESTVKTMTIIDNDGNKYESNMTKTASPVKAKGPIMQFDYVPSKPKLGVMVEDHEKGARIIEVIRNSPAALAGLQENDIIRGIGETSISNSADLVSSLKDPEEKIYVSYIRDEQAISVWIELSPFEFKSGAKETKEETIILKN